jgi:predicted nucleic acid-binding protein
MADYLMDTNVLIRLEDSSSPYHRVAVSAITKLRIQQHSLFVMPQNLIELYAVATRPTQSNGLGWSVADTVRICRGIVSRFQLAPADPRVYTEWLRLCDQYGIQGKRTHDVHLVAAM